MEIFLFKNISTRLDEFLQIVSSNLHKRLKQFVQKYVKTLCHRTSAVLSKFPFLTRTLIPYWYIQIAQVPQNTVISTPRIELYDIFAKIRAVAL